MRRIQSEKAQNKVCDAKADIGKQVNELAGLTAATVTKDAVTQHLNAIKTDLKDISDAQSDLSSNRRSEERGRHEGLGTSSIQEIGSRSAAGCRLGGEGGDRHAFSTRLRRLTRRRSRR